MNGYGLLTYLMSLTLNLLSLIPLPSPKAASDRPRSIASIATSTIGRCEVNSPILTSCSLSILSSSLSYGYIPPNRVRYAPLLNSVFHDQALHKHVFLLSDTMTSGVSVSVSMTRRID